MPTNRLHRIMDAIADRLWWSGHSSTHHNPEVIDDEETARLIKRLRRDGEHVAADEMQAMLDWKPQPQNFDWSQINTEIEENK